MLLHGKITYKLTGISLVLIVLSTLTSFKNLHVCTWYMLAEMLLFITT